MNEKTHNLLIGSIIGVIILLLLISVLSSGCSAIHQYPECLTGYDESAVITKLAHKSKGCPQNTAQNILLVSALAINVDKKIPDMGIEYAQSIIDFLTDPGMPITPQAIKTFIEREAMKYPGLMEITEINRQYIDRLMQFDVIDEFTINKIVGFLQERYIPRMHLYKRNL